MLSSVELFLQCFELDYKKDPNLRETPQRVTRMYEELLEGYFIDPKQFLKTFPIKNSDLVSLTNIPFFSLCSHHIIPFFGKIHIGYIPNGRVVGISKLIRFARVFTKRLNLQEELTENIANILLEHLKPQGIIVKIEAHHLCMSIRGVQSHNTVMTTVAKRGNFANDKEIVEEFYRTIRHDSNSLFTY